MAMLRTYTLKLLFIWALLLPLVAASAQDRSAIEGRLRDAMRGKIVTLRHFYNGKQVEFNARGNRLSGGELESWTLASKMRVEKIELKKQSLVIRGKRLIVLFQDGKTMKLVSNKESCEISISFDQPITADGVDAAVRKVFLSDDEKLSKVVPPYWYRFVANNIEGANLPPSALADLEDEVSKESPPLTSPVADFKSDSTPTPLPSPPSAFLISKPNSMQPPRVLYNPDPSYTDEARQLKYQGTVILQILVGRDGNVHNWRIDRALGAGLDDEAIQAVRRWRFDPAKNKNGDAFPAGIAVEVHFRLY